MLASLRSLIAVFLFAALVPIATPSPASAQSEEARLLFERGNEHLARGLRARGRVRARELDRALDAYLGVLSLGSRTRNVVFNTALTLAELGRHEEAFNYFGEYLRFDLSADERAEGERRRDALRPNVAVVRVESTPPGAEVRIDRRDLPVRGVTPIELAVPAGAHRVFVTREGYREASAEAQATVGTTGALTLALSPEPVELQVIAPGGGALTLDDQPIEPGRTIEIAPGAHVLRLEVEGGAPVERRFEVQVGDAPLVLELSAPHAQQARVAVLVDTPAELFVDGAPVGRGERFDVPIQPGPHTLRVSAPGYAPLVHRMSLEPAHRLQLTVDLGREADPSGVHVARAILGSLAVAGVATSIGLGVHALSVSDAWNEGVIERREDQREGPTVLQLTALADEVEHAALMTDVALGVTAALGVAAVIAIFVEPGGGEPSTVSVAAAPSPNGFVAALTWRAP